MLNAVFVVWRECFEAVLVVGILYSFLVRQEGFRRSIKFLAGGVFSGVILSACLAYAIQHAQTELQGAALDYFETGMLGIAAVLMTHMCIWMKQNARSIKKELEQGLATALSQSHLVGISLLAMLAVGREGAEIVIFFYGMGIESKAGGGSEIFLAAVIGASLTGLTAAAFYRGVKAFNPKWFFRVTTVFLLLTASTLLLTAARKLLQSGILPPILDQVWDTSFILDERSGVGSFVAMMTGYQSAPPLILVLIWCFYWIVSLGLYARPFRLSPAFSCRSGAAVWLATILGGAVAFSRPAQACPMVLPLGPSMQSPVTSADKMIRSLSLFMVKGLGDQSSTAVGEGVVNWTLNCNAFPEELHESLTAIIGPEGSLDWRLLRDLFETHFLDTARQRRQDGIIKSQVAEMEGATGFAAWESRMVDFSTIKRKSRRIFRSPENFTPKVSVAQTLDTENGSPSAAILETEVAVQRLVGGDWDFYSYNREGRLVNYSTFPAGDGPAPRTCLNCHYNSNSRVFNRFLP